MEKQSKHAVIVGAGVIGAACAYYLCRTGWTVTIVEKDRWGQGSSNGNCGLIVPSHVLPLNMPGVLWQGVQWMLKADAPLYIKPRLDPALAAWLIRFALRCNRRAMMQAATARSNMLKTAVDLYRGLIETEGLDCDWEAKGVLCVFRSPSDFASYAHTDALLRSFGQSSQLFNRRALQELEPTLRDDLAGGYLYPQAGHLRPDLLMQEFKRILTAAGVNILEQTNVIGFKGARDRVQWALTNRGSIAGDAFVVATGAWTPHLEKMLGVRVPIQPGKGYSLTAARPNPCPAIPCMFEEDRVVATPWASGYRLGGTMEFAGYDTSLNQRRLIALYQGARRYVKTLAWGPIEEAWCGWRPMTFDGLPIIDRTPTWQNVIIAAGHNMLGVSLAPGTGKLVSEILNGATPHLDPRPYRLKRFTGLI